MFLDSGQLALCQLLKQATEPIVNLQTSLLLCKHLIYLSYRLFLRRS